MSTKVKASLYILMMITCAAFFAIGFNSAAAEPPAPQLVAGEFLGNWQYQVWAEQGGYNSAHVQFNSGNQEELMAYVAQNKALAQELQKDGVKDLNAIITFVRPIPLVSLQKWVEDNNFSVESFTIRVSGPGGERVTVGGVSFDGKSIDQKHLNRILDNVARHGATDVRGIVNLEGTLPAKEYVRVAGDKDIFLVDVTRSVILHRLQKSSPQVHLGSSAILVPPVFPKLEDFGLTGVR
ncbi:hypothetical protein FBQ82_13870 [Anaerolineae bacterium CFX7]|nr:hypothetical protein [Anaerolineae bacterium CFX7]